ncbi:PPE family protein, SVP subgroup [Mycobacterium vicinigordonae]|uniref:PE domain-containing protein n=1 Tax=Mycobacterium vicinigordonae TaxID=1719132 RepID=A0A7D6I0B1_9MYCO|nr:PE domain-containing protein [Mycobacterium vicinigordonae]QLL09315.1 PE domain-containing protein [Mycobacterium vicinigordonae]
MSFLTTQTEELAAAAARLQTVGTQFVAQNRAAAASTTGILPAAADEVSALQASLFDAYGTLYQQVSADAAAMYDMFVHTLGVSAGTYAATEAANSVAAAAAPSPAASVLPSPLSDLANIVNIGVGNWASAASNFIGLANGALINPVQQGAEGAAAAGAAAVATTSAGAGPVVAAVGGASTIGALSAPPAWAGTTLVSATSAAPRAVGWLATAPQTAPATTFLPGMPGMVSTGRNSAGFGAPRYGVKPIVMAAAQV